MEVACCAGSARARGHSADEDEDEGNRREQLEHRWRASGRLRRRPRRERESSSERLRERPLACAAVLDPSLESCHRIRNRKEWDGARRDPVLGLGPHADGGTTTWKPLIDRHSAEMGARKLGHRLRSMIGAWVRGVVALRSR